MLNERTLTFFFLICCRVGAQSSLYKRWPRNEWNQVLLSLTFLFKLWIQPDPAAPIPDDSAMSRSRLTGQFKLPVVHMTPDSKMNGTTCPRFVFLTSITFSLCPFCPMVILKRNRFPNFIWKSADEARIVLNHFPQLISCHSGAWTWTISRCTEVGLCSATNHSDPAPYTVIHIDHWHKPAAERDCLPLNSIKSWHVMHEAAW